MFQIGVKKFLLLEKTKILCSGLAISDLNGEGIIETSSEKKQQKKKSDFSVEKVIERKGNKTYLNWKSYDNCF